MYMRWPLIEESIGRPSILGGRQYWQRGGAAGPAPGGRAGVGDPAGCGTATGSPHATQRRPLECPVLMTT